MKKIVTLTLALLLLVSSLCVEVFAGTTVKSGKINNKRWDSKLVLSDKSATATLTWAGNGTISVELYMECHTSSGKTYTVYGVDDGVKKASVTKKVKSNSDQRNGAIAFFYVGGQLVCWDDGGYDVYVYSEN